MFDKCDEEMYPTISILAIDCSAIRDFKLQNCSSKNCISCIQKKPQSRINPSNRGMAKKS